MEGGNFEAKLENINNTNDPGNQMDTLDEPVSVTFVKMR